jgi:thioredoxin reductase/SAM-dependent methyltransferase
VIGGSAAGLAAALQLGRQRRSVIVVDSGEPRNSPAAHMHGYLSREGVAPLQLLEAGREEVRSYGGEILAGRVVALARDEGRFRVELVGGHSIVARKVLAATGLVDQLPEIEGVAEHWGRGVIHCPFCHGFEVRDLRVVQLVTETTALHPAELFSHLTDRLTLVVDRDVDAGRLADLHSAGTSIVSGAARRIVTGEDGSIIAVELADGTRVEADAVVVSPRFAARAEPLAQLGLLPTPHPSGLGDVIETDHTGETAVAGLYAAGNVTDPSLQVLQAAADGSRVGAMISFSLAHADTAAAARPSASEADWDRRYAGRQMWSGKPNGSLVDEISALASGRVLDVGAGEGGDALWLAEHGWNVTANDISQLALQRLETEADRRGLAIRIQRADVNDQDPFGDEAFDLVTAMYASIPRTPDGRGVDNILGAVAPGGLLLVVSHDIAPMRSSIDTRMHSRAFDPDAYLRTDDFAAALNELREWLVELHEARPRPPGAASASHHVDDIVLRARRSETTTQR